MAQNPQEWLTQADYDFQTAEYMYTGGRYLYAVFMAHLAIEKALKGIYHKKFQTVPPKKHNLVYFLDKIQLESPEKFGRFLVQLNQANIATRYPEDLVKLQSIYTQTVVHEMLLSTKEILEWLKKKC